jgi:hypothetical protein
MGREAAIFGVHAAGTHDVYPGSGAGSGAWEASRALQKGAGLGVALMAWASSTPVDGKRDGGLQNGGQKACIVVVRSEEDDAAS